MTRVLPSGTLWAMHRWQVGEIEIVRVEDASFALPTEHPVPDWMIPAFAPSHTEIGLAFSAITIRTGDVRIVVDPWLADDGPRERPDAAAHVQGLLSALADAGFPATEVDVVVNSHIDGIGWNTCPDGHGGWQPTFPNARYLYPVAELDAVAAGENVFGGEHLHVLLDAGVVDPVPTGSGPVPVAPGVTLVDAPGHNAGHVAVRVESGGDVAVIPGHLVLSPFQIDDPSFNAGEVDVTVAARTRRSLLSELAERRGLLVATLLGGPGGGRVEATGSGFRLIVDHVGAR